MGYQEIDFPERQLLLNKLLVGLPPAHILATIADITGEEKELADSLMGGPLSNSSDAAIRATFL